MVGWSEFNYYDKQKKARMYGVSPYVGRRITHISPNKIFRQKLNSDRRFMRLKGNSSWSLSQKRDGSYYKKWYSYTDRIENSNWYLYLGEGNRRALIEIPEYWDMKCKVFLKILWVPPSIAGLGVGSEVMDILKEMTKEVDDLAKSGDKYKDLYVSCSSFIIYLIPNSFVVLDDYWNVEDIEKRKDNINWSANPEAEEKPNDPDYKLRDETFNYLDKEKLRLNLKQLQKFYIEKHGFVTCEELAINEYYDWDAGVIRRDLGITARSFCHQRWPLMWPPENLGFHERKIEE